MRRLLLLPAVTLGMFGAPALVAGRPAPPTPTVEEVRISPSGVSVDEGFRAKAKVEASLVGVTWDGDPEATFTVEVRDADGVWRPTEEPVGVMDAVPDPGSADARAAAHARRDNGSEPVWVEDASVVRVTVESGEAENVTVAAVDTHQDVPSGSAAASGVFGVDESATVGFGAAAVALAIVLVVVAIRPTPRRVGGRRRSGAWVAVAVVALAGCVVPAVPAPVPKPPPPFSMVMRWQWGALGFGSVEPCPSGPLYASPIKFGVVHHTAGGNSYSNPAAVVRGIQAYHMFSLRYCDIAYNFLVGREGAIFEGRAGGIHESVLAAHTGGFNSHSTGVAVLGTYSSVGLPAPAWISLRQLLHWKLETVHGVNVLARFSTVSAGGGSHWAEGTPVSFGVSLLGHRDLWPTGCPGNTLYGGLPALRNQIAAL